MCGIAGVLAFTDGFAADEATVARMTDALRHRGPDGAGTLVRAAERIALGHRRLAIVDLSDAGRQRRANEDESVWITDNGEVYNTCGRRAASAAASATERRSTTPHATRSRTGAARSASAARSSSGCCRALTPTTCPRVERTSTSYPGWSAFGPTPLGLDPQSAEDLDRVEAAEHGSLADRKLRQGDLERALETCDFIQQA